MADRRKFLKKTLMFFSATGILFTPPILFHSRRLRRGQENCTPQGNKDGDPDSEKPEFF